MSESSSTTSTITRWCGSNFGWNFFVFPIPNEGDTGVNGGEEGVDDSEEAEEKAAEEVVDDDAEEIDTERVCVVLLFTGVLYIGIDEDKGELGDLLPVIRLVAWGMRDIPSSFKLPRPFRRFGLVPFAPSRSAPHQIDGIAVAL